MAVNTEQLFIPYLGNPEPSVIRLPRAVNGSLVDQAVIFGMYGLAAEAPQFLGRVSLRVA